MNDIFVTADLHLGHDKNKNGYGGIVHHARRINPLKLKLFDNIRDHDDFIIFKWNRTVGKKDLTYILGDFAWRDHSHYIMALNGKKILITGSHDRMSLESRRLFTEYHEGMLVRTINKMPFVMTHCAMLVWERSHYGAINLHGHSHGRLKELNDIKRMDVGIDVAVDYTPFSMDFILYKMSLKEVRKDIRSADESYIVTSENKENNKKLLDQYIQKGGPHESEKQT